MELKIIPALCKEQKNEETGEIAPPVFEGSVTIRLPNMPEVFRFKAKYGKQLAKDGEIQRIAKLKGQDLDDSQKAEMLFASMELIAQIAEDIKDFWLKIELKEVATGQMVDSVEKLYYYEPAFGVIADIGMRFVQGFAEKN